MAEYFGAEKSESLLFMLVGVAATATAIFLWRAAPAWRGMAVPLVAVAAIQIVVGGSVYFRTDAQLKTLTAQMQQTPAEFRNAELKRMDTVNKNFAIYKLVEILLLASGILLTYFFNHNDFVFSAGHGFIIQSAFMLILDLFAERRAEYYVAQINQLLGV